ncbi:MAG TPA: hypothetical protein VGD98_08935 [Ktedonobacteraceae bacterium]
MFQKNIRARTSERLFQEREKWLARENKEQLAQQQEELPGRAAEEQSAQLAEQRLIHDLEQRLSAYYGPAQPEQRLPEAAWLNLRGQLWNSPRSRKHRLPRPGRLRLRLPSRPVAPFELQQIYMTLLLQTNYRSPAPDLHCTFRRRSTQPRVSARVLGDGRINLVLPRENWQMLEKAEVDMLLAAGLARCRAVSRSLFLLPRALFALSLLLLLAVLPLTSVDRRAVWIFLAAVACCLLSGRLLIWQQRVQAFRGDRLAVQWLGRERVCRGLHQLAGRGQPARRPNWGEPSLNERIARICGTPIAQKNKHLTLVG